MHHEKQMFSSNENDDVVSHKSNVSYGATSYLEQKKIETLYGDQFNAAETRELVDKVQEMQAQRTMLMSNEFSKQKTKLL